MNRIRTISISLIVGMSMMYTYAQETSSDETDDFTASISASSEVTDQSVQEDLSTERLETKAENSNKGNRQNHRKSKDKNPINWLSVLALALGGGGIAAGALSLLRINELNAKTDSLKDKNKKKFQELLSKIESLQQELNISCQKLEKNQSEISLLRHAQTSNTGGYRQEILQQPGVSIEQPVSHAHRASTVSQSISQEPVKLYCGVPRGGVFTMAPTRQPLYVINDNGRNSGTYSFMNSRDNAMVAARSKSDFLEPACVIKGNPNPNFTQVRTITPGTVRKTSNGWVIESKAIVELV